MVFHLAIRDLFLYSGNFTLFACPIFGECRSSGESLVAMTRTRRLRQLRTPRAGCRSYAF